MSTVTWRVPGRVEVLGKHTDYAGGNVLICAIDLGVTVTASPGESGVTAHSDASADIVRLAAGVDPGLPPGHWGRYVQTVVDRFAFNFGPLEPVDVTVTSDLPLASGMSSSSALVTGVGLALADFHGFSERPEWRQAIENRLDLAGYLASVEGGSAFRNLAGMTGVGTKGGSEDHTAMLCSEEGRLGQFSFSPMRLERRVSFPADHSLVIAVSGVAAEKTGAAKHLYNRASHLVTELLQAWNWATGRSDTMLQAAVNSSPDAEAKLRELAERGGGEAVRRLNHFLGESNRIIPGAVEALEGGDLQAFGRWSDESQALATTDLNNQVPETIALARTARELGATGAASFGAGFGGSVWALVPTADAEAFGQTWLDGYRAEFPEAGQQATYIVTRPSASAQRIN